MEQRVAIFELQDALAQILAARGFPWVVSHDGIFGPETTEAVRMFQQMEGLEQTGEVDRALWELIQTRLTELIEQGRIQPLPVFPNNSFVLQPGAGGLLVGLIQGMLMQIGEQFANVPKPSLSYEYDRTTADAVGVIQQMGGLDPDGAVGRETWNLLVQLYTQLE